MFTLFHFLIHIPFPQVYLFHYELHWSVPYVSAHMQNVTCKIGQTDHGGKN